jgi:hypothetical protein
VAQISEQHVQPLTMGFVALLVGSLLALAALNKAANWR